MKIIIIFVEIALTLTIILGSFVVKPTPVVAWEQGLSGTHEALNREAALRFFRSIADDPKYASSPVDRTKNYVGSQIVSSSLAQSGLRIEQNSLKFEDWLVSGGFSADEPELWACVRHFYDPLSLNGAPQLTDHNWLHGIIYDAISAKQWAFTDSSNPYNWNKTLEYYKKAMEIPEDAIITVVPGTGFRDPDIPVSSREQARNVYLGKAFRALGETMHMIADMTQPAHNRNDSHPNGDLDPIESTANANTVLLVKDATVDLEAANAIAAAGNAVDMYEQLALYTNRNFYTDDTIFDQASGVNPRNWENSYPHPQFSDLKEDKSYQQKTYVKQINGKDVHLVQQTYTSWKLGASIWQDYQVPSSFVNEQAEVLMPIAIMANTKLINLFFPTMSLSIEVKEKPTIVADLYYKEFAVTSSFVHSIGSDPDWQANGFSIEYSGPGELWVETDGAVRKLGDLSFKYGSLDKPIAVFVGDESKAQTDIYHVNDKDNLFIIVNAGGRTFRSSKYAILAQSNISIKPSAVTVSIGAFQSFTAEIDLFPPDPSLEWLVDGKSVAKINDVNFETAFDTAGQHTVQLRLHSKEKVVNTAVAQITVTGSTSTSSTTTKTTTTQTTSSTTSASPTGTGIQTKIIYYPENPKQIWYQYTYYVTNHGDVKDGTWTEFWLSGNKKDVCLYKDGVKQGNETWYYDQPPPNVQQTFEYIDGVLNGENRAYLPNGDLYYIQELVNGLLNGTRSDYINGILHSIVEYKGGKQNGTEKWYYPSGRLQFTQEWKDGSTIYGTQTWYPDN